MKKFTSIIIAVVVLVLCFTLCACGNMYASKYKASQMVTSNTSNSASISFGSFSGTYVMKLQNNSADEARITYKASLGEGNIKVYYDYNGEKLNLFEIESNGSVDSKTEAFKGNKTIYIIIESDGECIDGNFSFALGK